MSANTTVLTHAAEILTGEGFVKKQGRHPNEEDIGRIEDGALVTSQKKILWVGPTKDLPKKYLKEKKKNLKNLKSITAGWIDCHTHLVFAGDRSEEFAARCAGATYEQIAAKGGGILKTVNATREASEKELYTLANERLNRMKRFGIKTIETKSGYGLTTESEIKLLRVVKKLKAAHNDLTLHSTFLGAHAIPKDLTQKKYVEKIINEMLPIIAKEKLADSCDVFIDRGYFTVAEGKEILTKAKTLGLKTRIHADELANTESAALACELGSLSADHLLQVSEKGIAALSKSETVSVLLPGTAFYLKAAYAPARKLIDAGARIALATDFNPGTCMCDSLPAILTLGALYMKMSRAELLCAITYNAAKALGLEAKKGALTVGRDSDFTLLDFVKFEETYYRFAW